MRSSLCQSLGIAVFSSAVMGAFHFASGLEEASGVNLSLEEGFGARQQGLALRFAGYGKAADVVANSPANMNDINDLTFSTSHSERFAQAQLDHFAMLLPVDNSSTLGIGLARYGVSGIEFRPEGSEASVIPPSLFTTADYWITTAFSRRLGHFDLGGTLQILYRDLDQSGFGLRGDAMVNYSPSDQLRIQTLLVGLLPSTARWSSGYSEYESPDLRFGVAYQKPAPYLYGQWQFAWETEGLFQSNSKSVKDTTGSRGAFHLNDALSTSNFGAEFVFDFGLALRAGLEEIRFPSELGNLWHAGIGYSWKGIAGIDYAFTPHPDLPSSHRIAIQWTPVFPKFSGKNYRKAPALKPLPSANKAHENGKTKVSPSNSNTGQQTLEQPVMPTGMDEVQKGRENIPNPGPTEGKVEPDPIQPQREVLED